MRGGFKLVSTFSMNGPPCLVFLFQDVMLVMQMGMCSHACVRVRAGARRDIFRVWKVLSLEAYYLAVGIVGDDDAAAPASPFEDL